MKHWNGSLPIATTKASERRSCAVQLLLVLMLAGCGSTDGDDSAPVSEVNASNAPSEPDTANTAEDSPQAEDGGSAPYCGDGNVDEGEICDDGNEASNDGCAASCEAEIVEIVNLGFNLNSAGPCGVDNDRECGASYSMTFTLENFTEVAVERITRIGFRAEGVEISSGGTVCDHPVWLVPANSESGLLDIAVTYVPGLFTLYSECRTSQPLFYWETPVETTDHYFETGRGVLSINGMLADGTAFATQAEAALVDLR